MTAVPDRIAAPDEPLHCPLCDYDLRATTDERCPECGYAFTWNELRDPARRLHPYAFEHHPERNVRSFIQTFFAGLLPKRFWRTLYPTQPSRPKRLLLYWVLVSLAFAAPVVIQTARRWPVVEAELRAQRKMAMAAVAQLSDETAGGILDTYPSTQAYVDAWWPVPTTTVILRSIARFDGVTRTFAFVFGALAVWPWLTFTGLMIFQFSMRRARIKPIHVLRCVLYTSDLALWATAATLTMMAYDVLRFGWAGARLWRAAPLDATLVCVVALAFLGYTWRLGSAYRHYLRFLHAFATALSVQVMILLLLTFIAIEWNVLRP